LILLEELEREEERVEDVRVLPDEDPEMREGDALLKDRDEEELLDDEMREEDEGEEDLSLGEV
jgi:hypothetical protein